MKRIMHLLVLSCRRASVLIEKKNNFGLGFIERIQLRWHKNLCDACSSYEKQSEFIEEALKKHVHDPVNYEKKELTQEEKEKIKEKI